MKELYMVLFTAPYKDASYLSITFIGGLPIANSFLLLDASS
jgi:hypothetical protein